MGHLEVGPKETTGPVRNENGYVHTFDDPRRFITTYQMKYVHWESRFVVSEKPQTMSFLHCQNQLVISTKIPKVVIAKDMWSVGFNSLGPVALLKIRNFPIRSITFEMNVSLVIILIHIKSGKWSFRNTSIHANNFKLNLFIFLGVCEHVTRSSMIQPTTAKDVYKNNAKHFESEKKDYFSIFSIHFKRSLWPRMHPYP